MFTEAEHQTQNTVMDKEMKNQSGYTLHIQQINKQNIIQMKQTKMK